MKMRIRILQPVMLAGQMILKGRLVEIARVHANELVARGLAEEYTDDMAAADAAAKAKAPAK